MRESAFLFLFHRAMPPRANSWRKPLERENQCSYEGEGRGGEGRGGEGRGGGGRGDGNNTQGSPVLENYSHICRILDTIQHNTNHKGDTYTYT